MPPIARQQISGLFALAFAVASGQVTAAPLADVKLEIWVRAFIPDHHPNLPDYIRTTALGTTVLEAPWVPKLGSLGKLKGTCFTTDNRSFSFNPAASSRVSVYMLLEARGRSLKLVSSSSVIGVSHNVDCTSGKELQPSRTASNEGVSIGSIVVSGFNSVLNVKISEANPFFSMPLTPKIDLQSALTYDGLTRHLQIKGYADYFPSFEMFVRKNSGPPISVLQWGPYEKSTAINLFDLGLGVNSRNFSGDIDLSK